jgi:peptide/nickel transport system substrate-binding protein
MLIGTFAWGVAGPSPLGAADPSVMTVGMRGDTETFDQHLSTSGISWSYQFHVFDALVHFDPGQKPVPGLAEAWRLLDETTWEFKLRKGVRFHHGEPFTAADAKFSLDRARTHPKSLQKGYVALVKEVRAVDPHTLHLKTERVFPDLLPNLTNIAIYPEKHHKEVGDAAFAQKPVGTGPYRLQEWVKDRHAVLTASDTYWGGAPAVKHLTFRPIPEGTTRVAALLRGEVQLIEAVPFADLKRVAAHPGVRVLSRPGTRMIYLGFDAARAKGGPAPAGSPGLPDGAPNPFLDVRVRRAVYHALDIDELVKFVMGGAAYPADQFVPSVWFGAHPGIQRPPHDLALAKRLLAEAGYPNGFKVRMDSTSDRYVNDKELAIAIAGQLAKAGITVEVNAMPRAIFFPKMQALETSMHQSGWGGTSASHNLLALFGTIDRKTGAGRANYGGYSNRHLDRLIEQAMATTDADRRLEHFRAAAELIRDQAPKIPLHYENVIHALADRYDMPVRIDDQIRLFEVTVKR